MKCTLLAPLIVVAAILCALLLYFDLGVVLDSFFVHPGLTTTTASTSHSNNALVLHGGRLNSLLQTAISIRANVVDVLGGMDVFVVGSQMNATTRTMLRVVFGSRLKVLVVMDQIEAVGVNAWVDLSLKNDWSDPRLKCVRTGYHKPSTFHFHYTKEVAYRILQGHESQHRDGKPYEHIIFMRPGMVLVYKANPRVTGDDRFRVACSGATVVVSRHSPYTLVASQSYSLGRVPGRPCHLCASSV
jgi:hypothetical protein